jgi:glycosyltransferase involved in cell wall biosynthesis
MKTNLLKPKVTVCVPSFNSSSTLEKTIKSILKQSYYNYNIFFFDNSSNDNTINIIKYYLNKFKNFKKFYTNKNILYEKNFNKIISKKFLFGKYFCVFHSDDIYNKNILNDSVNYLEKNLDCAAVSSTAILIDENDCKFSKTVLPYNITKYKNFKLSKNQFIDLIFDNGNFLITPSFVFRTQSFINNPYIFKYKKYRTASDLHLWLQILEKEKIGIINKPLINYRLSKYGYTLRSSRLRIKDSDFFLVLQNILKKYKKTKNRKYPMYIKKMEFLLMKDRCRQLINAKLRGIKKKIDLKILNNMVVACYNYKNFVHFFYVVLIRFFTSILFSRFFIKNILILKRYFGYPL